MKDLTGHTGPKDFQTLRQRPQCRHGASPSRLPPPPKIPTRLSQHQNHLSCTLPL